MCPGGPEMDLSAVTTGGAVDFDLVVMVVMAKLLNREFGVADRFIFFEGVWVKDLQPNFSVPTVDMDIFHDFFVPCRVVATIVVNFGFVDFIFKHDSHIGVLFAVLIDIVL